jgi:hypothetical protein
MLFVFDPTLAKTIPVKPPNVNKKIKPNTNNIEVSNLNLPPHIVAIQLNTLIPVGTAMIIVAAVKYARVSTSNPTVNIWWAHTINPKTPIETIA